MPHECHLPLAWFIHNPPPPLAPQAALRDIIASDPDVFGACIAYQPGVFNGEARRSFYACRDTSGGDGDDRLTADLSTARKTVKTTGSGSDVNLDEWPLTEGSDDDDDGTTGDSRCPATYLLYLAFLLGTPFQCFCRRRGVLPLVTEW
jgi:hypothetical protein